MAEVKTSTEPHSFILPEKRIKNHSDLQKWIYKGESYKRFLEFIQGLGESVIGLKVSDKYYISDTIKKICELYDELSQYVDEIPPIENPARFGNKAYRTWFKRMSEESKRMTLSILPESLSDAEIELSEYWRDSWGNETRIDYGTGHEMFMASFLFCLFVLGVLTREDFPAIVLQCFYKYLELVRKIQKVYKLEPAGSHGVWSLDDYQALPFYLGACQLQDSDIKPSEGNNQEAALMYADEYIYFSCIKYIFEVKTGPFFEHSPVLYSASQAESWKKVTNGMFKLYKEDVLGKFPILQHFKFGSIMNWVE